MTAKRILCSARVLKGYTQADIAKIMKVSTQTYSRWENNIELLPFGKLCQLCKILGIKISDLEV